jgi:hypothetical protein
MSFLFYKSIFMPPALLAVSSKDQIGRLVLLAKYCAPDGRALIFADSVRGMDIALPFVRHAIIGSLKEGQLDSMYALLFKSSNASEAN